MGMVILFTAYFVLSDGRKLYVDWKSIFVMPDLSNCNRSLAEIFEMKDSTNGYKVFLLL